MSRRVIISVTNDLSIDQRVHRIACTLVENGWEVLLLGRQLPGSPVLARRPYQTHRLRLWVRKGALFYLMYNLRLFLYLLRAPAHTLLSTDMDTLPGNWLAARMRGRGLIYDSHEYWTEVPELIGRPRVRAVWLWLERRLFPRVDKAMTVNESIAEIYKKAYNLSVISIRNLPFRLPTPPERQNPGRILMYQGALNVGRGLELMIAAVPHLPEGYVLRIAGMGPLFDSLNAQVVAAGLERRVQLLGHVPFSELPALTCEAALGMSLEADLGASYRLALPNKLFDYIQSGIPVPVSDLPEMAAVVREYGVGSVLEAGERNAEGLAGRIRAIVEDDAGWLALRRNALGAAALLCWEKEAEKVVALFGKP